MRSRIRFYLDENVPKVVSEGLLRRGVDALSVRDAGLLGVPDEAHLNKARSENRVIFTQDADFLRLHSAGCEHAGIVYAQQGMAIGRIISGLMLIYQALDTEEMINHVEYL